MSRYSFAVGPLILTVIWSVWHFGFSPPTLLDLQKEMIRAETAADTTRVINQLEQFYLRRSVADSVRLRLAHDVQVLIDTTSCDVSRISSLAAKEENVYQLEARLKRLFALAMTSKAQGNDHVCLLFMRQAGELAARVDVGLGCDYWVPFVRRMRDISANDAKNWLLAKRAAELCRRTITNRPAESMQYASLALRMLKEFPDMRLWLEVMQRVQYWQYDVKSAFDLSIGLGRRLSSEALKSCDVLRVAGTRFNGADAVFRSGQILVALLEFRSLLEMTQMNRSVPMIGWYEEDSIRFMASCYWQLGQFQKALSSLERFGRYDLSPQKRVQLYTEAALVHRRLGRFELAEREYKLAIHLADSTKFVVNQTRVRLNLASMLEGLTEFDEARRYYDEASRIMQGQPVANAQHRIDYLLGLARIEYHFGRHDEFKRLLAEAQATAQSVGDSPSVRVKLLRSLGAFYDKEKQHELATENFREAAAICRESGLQRIGIALQLSYARGLVMLGRHEEAELVLNEVLEVARSLGDRENVIDALALKVENLAGTDRIERAAAVSDTLIAEIDDLSRRFERFDRLLAYRQKIYGYLKRSVVDELQFGREVAAFAKLDYSKAYALKQRRQGVPTAVGRTVERVDVEELKQRLDPNAAILDYVVTDSALCLFVLTGSGLQVLQKSLDVAELRNEVMEYTTLIRKTISLFQGARSGPERARHFAKGNEIGHRIYRALFGWPAVDSLLNDTNKLYIVPDDFLFDLPFSTLPVSSSLHEPRYLAEQSSVVVLPGHSLVRVDGERERPENPALPPVVISVDCELVGGSACRELLDQLSPFARRLSVKKAEITREDVVNALNDGVSALVIIGHGLADDREPEKSYIEVTATSTVSGASKRFRFTLSDFRRISWKQTTLVMLAGCETGSGRLYRGSGNLSLLQGLVSLGASNVLATQWKTDVRTTMPQCKSFLRAWQETGDPVWALNKVEVEAIRRLRRDPYYEKPYQYFWGGFQLASLNK